MFFIAIKLDITMVSAMLCHCWWLVWLRFFNISHMVTPTVVIAGWKRMNIWFGALLDLFLSSSLLMQFFLRLLSESFKFTGIIHGLRKWHYVTTFFRRRKSQNLSRLRDWTGWLKSSAVLLSLLGVTWVFGLLYVNTNTTFMAYIFTVTNSLQGLLP